MHHARHIRGGIRQILHMAFNAIAVQINKDQLFGNVLIQQGVSRRCANIASTDDHHFAGSGIHFSSVITITRERKLPPQARFMQSGQGYIS
jgi:hypothetical protein